MAFPFSWRKEKSHLEKTCSLNQSQSPMAFCAPSILRQLTRPPPIFCARSRLPHTLCSLPVLPGGGALLTQISWTSTVKNFHNTLVREFQQRPFQMENLALAHERRVIQLNGRLGNKRDFISFERLCTTTSSTQDVFTASEVPSPPAHPPGDPGTAELQQLMSNPWPGDPPLTAHPGLRL